MPRAVGRIGRRGIDRRRIGQPRGRLRAQVHHEQVRIAALLQAHDDALAVRREPRRERHAGEIADDLALPGLDVEQIDPRIALAEFHIGDFLGRRREPRRQHQIGAARQIAHIGAVLIHQRQPLDAAFRRAAFVDEHHAAVEIALLAGQALIDLVGNDVRDPPPVFRRGEILLAGRVAGRWRRPTAGIRPSGARRPAASCGRSPAPAR